MRNKKGFTLVEIIAVTVLIIVITVIAVPAVLKMIRYNRIKSSDAKLDVILKQAKQYAMDNTQFIYDSNKIYINNVCNSITVKDLLDAGYLKEILTDGSNGSHVIDPLTGEYLDNTNIVIYINSSKPFDSVGKYVGSFVAIYKPSIVCSESEPYVEFAFTGEPQTYTAAKNGYYRLQVWGAQGGYNGSDPRAGGAGGYSEGLIYLTQGEVVYVYVGGSGNSNGNDGGWNGGGPGVNFRGGGGATDMRVEGDTLYHRIIVAGGGGAGNRGASLEGSLYGGAGGGIVGKPCNTCGEYENVGTQKESGQYGSFGQGGKAQENCGGIDGAGGGGWYGGGPGNHWLYCWGEQAGGGGSGFVYDGTNEVPEDYAVKNHVLTRAFTISGVSSRVPTYDGTGTKTGQQGDGYAKITVIGSEI